MIVALSERLRQHGTVVSLIGMVPCALIMSIIAQVLVYMVVRYGICDG